MSHWLLDVNALLALFDPEHSSHESVQRWFGDNRHDGWATCAITENGFARIASAPSYTNPLTLTGAITRLHEATLADDHERWVDDVSILDPDVIDHARLHGPRQITDVYLLALAVRRDGCLVTLDRSVPLSAVRGAEPRHLLVL